MKAKDDYLKEMIFEMFKDEKIGSSSDFRSTLSKQNLIINDPGSVFVRITNYQIEKYGCALGHEDRCQKPPRNTTHFKYKGRRNF